MTEAQQFVVREEKPKNMRHFIVLELSLPVINPEPNTFIHISAACWIIVCKHKLLRI